MPIPQKIKNFLEKNKVKYAPVKHRTVYTAYDKARTLRLPEKIIGKTLALKINLPAGGKKLAVVLIPANKNLDKNKFKKIARTKEVDFASERIMKNKLKGVKVGAIPPFGNLWGLATFIDKSLMDQPEIIVNSGGYNWSAKISPAALKKLIPDLTIGSFSKVKR